MYMTILRSIETMGWWTAIQKKRNVVTLTNLQSNSLRYHRSSKRFTPNKSRGEIKPTTPGTVHKNIGCQRSSNIKRVLTLEAVQLGTH